ncbi:MULTISPECIES: LysM peptidoglycan-binding domain-containing protein [Cobetia]|uniref:LysM peptidoglycan-binding domain-containing protein n=1 Tax=Cobetia crustatorum TaxID=553385 RepID=A0A558HI66_9GAMM|nr:MULTISPECIES: LysM peptidoglycan-binding domain-containing protein [Cobetia]TVU68738.1 LysM peptidoglycan-binding domain-containing protein [Cobetia crustatorum]
MNTEIVHNGGRAFTLPSLSAALRWLGLACLSLWLGGCATGSYSGSPAGQWVTIQQGDTLGKIARDADIPLLRLTRFNPGVKIRDLKVGQRILVPTASERAPSGGPYRYQMRPGDTYSKVGRYFAASPQRIQAANTGLNPNDLKVGTLISVPLNGGPSRSSAPVGRASAGSLVARPDPGPLKKPRQLWRWPASGQVTREFGTNGNGQLAPMQIRTGTNGVASAPAKGQVRFADTMRQLGNVVIIHHSGNLQSVLAQCGEILAKVGQQVTPGTPLCRVAQSHNGQHELLFDVRHGGKPINPRDILEKR